MKPADSERMRAAFRGFLGGGQRPDSVARARMTQFNTDQPFVLRNAGAVGILLDAGKEQDLLNMSRSEEHTSELQSRPHLVCRLLLEKKKKKKKHQTTQHLNESVVARLIIYAPD